MNLFLLGTQVVVGRPLAGDGADAIRGAAHGRRIAIVSDANVAPLHAAPLSQRLGVASGDQFEVPAGESSKSREQWGRLTDAMLERGFGRDTVVVAVGGGVVGDLAGFTAATFMRGVPVVQVPTSLLAMIDAAIGGKTGVDTPMGKNLVGAFHQPALVVADPLALATLPAAHVRNGLAEALKHAVLTGPDELEWLLANAAGLLRAGGPDSAVAQELVERNIRIKADVVAHDERESGVRKTLNFGHTIGHAVEAAAGYSILHGECVAIGMRVEAMIAESLGLAASSLTGRITSAIRALELPVRPPASLAADAILEAMRTDKKARGGAVEFALMSDLGAPAGAATAYGTPVGNDIIVAALSAAFAP